MKDYGVIGKPLTNLLKKKQFRWSEEAEQAFQKLKSAMTMTPVLVLPDFEVAICCGVPLGLGVLMQQGRPVAFLSKALSEHHKHLSIYEKEFLALIMAVEN